MNEEQVRKLIDEATRGGGATDQFRISTTSLHSHDGVDGMRFPFTNLSDTPTSYYGSAGRSVMVNDNTNLLQFSGGVLTTTATTGFMYFPTCAGTPTGTPASGRGAVVYDTTANKIWVYNGSAWKYVTMT